MGLKAWTEKLVNSRHMLWGVFLASLLEATFLPIPLEVVLIPLMVTQHDRVWRIATATLAGCLVGALLGYGVGYFLYETAGRWLVETFGWESQATALRRRLQDNGFWVVLSVGITPIPFQLAELIAGATRYPLALFLLAAAVARGVRYYGLALVVHLMGERAKRVVAENKTAVALTSTGLVIAGYLIYKLAS